MLLLNPLAGIAARRLLDTLSGAHLDVRRESLAMN